MVLSVRVMDPTRRGKAVEPLFKRRKMGYKRIRNYRRIPDGAVVCKWEGRVGDGEGGGGAVCSPSACSGEQ